MIDNGVTIALSVASKIENSAWAIVNESVTGVQPLQPLRVARGFNLVEHFGRDFIERRLRLRLSDREKGGFGFGRALLLQKLHQVAVAGLALAAGVPHPLGFLLRVRLLPPLRRVGVSHLVEHLLIGVGLPLPLIPRSKSEEDVAARRVAIDRPVDRVRHMHPVDAVEVVDDRRGSHP